jgi:hypothetical protein
VINEEFTLIRVTEDGRNRLKFMAPKRYQKFVDSLGDGQELRCRITDPARGLRHNSKLHAVIGEAAEVLGWEDPTEFKERLLERIRPDEEDPITGFMRRKRTRDMSNEEIDQLVMEIKAFVQHLMPGYIFRFDFELQAKAS